MTISPENHSAKESTPPNPQPTASATDLPSRSASTASTLPVDSSKNVPEKSSTENVKPPVAKLDTQTASTPPRTSQEQQKKAGSLTLQNVDNTAEFEGNLDTNNDAPSAETVRKIGEYMVLDQDGKSVPFKNVYSGPNVVRRVLVVFIRHFFCGNCQEYVRTLSSNPALSPNALLSLSPPTFICVIGCGSPSLIPHYIEQTSCPYPIYADPTRQLYSTLNMVRTFHAGKKQPEYMKKTMFGLAIQSVVQGVKQVGKGNVFKHGEWGGGDLGQVGGEFLFEPLNGADYSPGGISPGEMPGSEVTTPRGGHVKGDDYLQAGARRAEEMVVTWCHRMKNTRDHAEIKDLMKVLGVDPETLKKNKEMVERKLTGMSSRSRNSTTNDVEEVEKKLEANPNPEIGVR